MHKLVQLRRVVHLERKDAVRHKRTEAYEACLPDIDLDMKGKPAEKEKPKKVANGNENGAVVTGAEASGNVCRIEDSPYRIMKVASSGNLKEFERLYNADNSRIKLKDTKGQTVLHHAASKGKVRVMDFILNHGGDINVQDKKGNTPLHVAVERKNKDGVDFLVKHFARSDVLNNYKMAALHFIVETGQAHLIAPVIATGNVDIEGEFGQTPLHYAATKGQTECAKQLLHYGASLDSPCNVGYHPVHIAAKEAATGVLEAIFESAQTRGCLVSVIGALDKERNSPLHSAVNSGNGEAVRVCLKHGAAIEAKQNDHATPLHLACAQGNLTMIKFMLEMRPDTKYNVIFLKDAMDMTPLHTAALFDHSDVVEYLISQGSDIDSQDREGRTPLLVAASNQAWNTVKVLLSSGANMGLNDNKGRNFLHLSILNGARLKMLALEEDTFKDGQELLNQMDEFGCTPLHYASREGNLSTIEHLIGLGALMNIKNKEKQSPLHFAARYGRVNTCVRLLASSQGAHIINETDGEGLTALHIASQNGHVKIVQLLLQKGAVLQRDHKENTPLHLAAENGYNQTMKVLLGVHSYILNAKNQDGNSGLHLASRAGRPATVKILMTMSAEFIYNNEELTFFDLAIENRHKDVASHIIGHERWKEAMDLRSREHDLPMIALIKFLPEVCQAVLDRCQSTSEHDEKSKNFYHIFDFRYLQNPSSMEAEKKKRGEETHPMMALNVMVQFNRVELLSHPVCVTFLNMKWRAYGFWIHMANIGIYGIFLVFLTTHICTVSPEEIATAMSYQTTVNPPPPGWVTTQQSMWNDSLGTISPDEFVEVTKTPSHDWGWPRIGMLVMTVLCVLNMLKELMQLYQQKFKYFTDTNNYLEWILYVTASLFVMPDLFNVPFHAQWECGAIAVFLAWFNLLLYLQRFDLFGIYVVMFLEILKTLIQVIIVFSILIIAFGLSFYILMATEDRHAHRTPLLSFMRTFVMMLGEIDYIPTYVEPLEDGDPNTMRFGTVTFLFLIVFILLMPILLMNLLIGLAVGDIESVQRNARLKRLAMQVELHTDLEAKIPQRILRYVDKDHYKVYPRSSNKFVNKIIGRFFNHMVRTEQTKSGMESASQTLIIDELLKQKRRIKDVTDSIDKQHELLKLIVQKMEIHSEAENQDEGATSAAFSSGDSTPFFRSTRSGGSSWGNPRLRGQLIKQASVVAQWTKAIPEKNHSVG